jgi:uncharacterized membrane protein
MKIKRSEIIVAVIILLSFAVSWYFYPQVPESPASHWNAAGEADGYTSRFAGVFLLPIVSAACAVLLLALPRISVLRARFDEFSRQYYGFTVALLLFLLYIHMLTVYWNLGYDFNMTQMLVPGMAALVYAAGAFIGNVKMNRWAGIRTPWTLASEQVWEKTHRLGGVLFKIAGVITLQGIFFPEYAFYFIVIPIAAAAAVSVVYSYLEYKKEEAGKRAG